MHKLYGFCLFIILHFSMVHAGGHLSIKLINYINSSGKGRNNRKCDGRFGITFSACDHRFVICADKQTGGDSMDTCYFGRMETPVFPNADVLSFPNEIRGMKNPILFNVSSWPASGTFKLKFDIWDYDRHSRDEHVEYLYKKLTIKPSGHIHNYTGQRFMLHSRTRLTVELAVFCDEYYFGQSCNIYCQKNSIEHYLCDSNGQKHCMKGWRGPECRLIDHCADLPCRNNGKCLQEQNAFLCECQNGYAGIGYSHVVFPDPHLSRSSESFTLCTGVNLTATAISDPGNLDQKETLHVISDAKYATWLRDRLENCSRHLVRLQERSNESPGRVNEEEGSVSWYPLSGLVVVPLVIVIVCCIVFRKKLMKSGGSGEHLALSKSVYTEIDN
ncbi:delta-like protein 1 isoform X2 [Ostrea edulis]|uniref:delta-like protein 1 isoform X2 n=1 Tax=Ostrea edulis TaxID=37623 RepID=UPI0024AFD818|nr:delta-like protein 1 isoform X2 [Ostrea edulis]